VVWGCSAGFSIRVVSRLGVARVAVGLLVFSLVAGGAAGALSRGSRANRSAAKADAARQLGAISLPAGAREVGSDPSASSTLGGRSGVVRTAFHNVIDDHRFWRVPGDPVSVESWVKAHAPAGSHLRSTGEVDEVPAVRYVWFTFPSASARVLERSLAVEVTSARGGGTAVRADGVAVWLLTRPKWDLVPRSVRVVTATFGIPGVPGARSRSVTFSVPHIVGRVVRLINRAVVIQPAFRGCPKAVYETFALAFRARRGGAAIARATVFPTGCRWVRLAVGGRRGLELNNAKELTSLLLAAGAVAPCARRNIALGRSDRAQGPGMYADFAIRGRRPCDLAQRPTVKLLGAKRQTLSTPISYATDWMPSVIAPSLPIDMLLSWRGSCRRKAARAVQLSLPGLQRPLVAPVGSKRHPVEPCRGQIQFTPLSLL
jgi:hypothetical protein